MSGMRCAPQHRWVVAATSLALVLTGCWSAPEEPRPVAGMRVVEGQLELWAGAGCPGVSAVALSAVQDDEVVDTWETTATSPEGATLETLSVGGDNAGFTASGRGLDWQDAEVIRMVVSRPDTPRAASGYWDVERLAGGGSDGQWLVQDVGWLTEDQFADLGQGDGGRYPLCEVPGQSW